MINIFIGEVIILSWLLSDVLNVVLLQLLLLLL